MTKRNRGSEYTNRKEKCALLNICFKCSAPKDNNKWKCNSCLATDRQNDREKRARRKLKNLCDCGRQALSNKSRCGQCAIKYKDAQTKRRNHHRSIGKCLTCGDQPMAGLKTCKECSNRATTSTLKRYEINKKNGVCPFCGGEINDKFRCKNCHKKHLDRSNKNRLIVLEHYGNKCVCCEESTYEFLEIDHINSDGAEHRKEIGRHIVEDIIKRDFPSDLQILCANCNRGKGKFGICPHKQELILPKTKSGDNRRKRRIKAIDTYGGKCVCCGESRWPFLEFDHIDGDGKQHREILKGKSIVSWLIKEDFPKGIQLLCCNCNKAKGLYGCCPHTKKASKILS